MKKISFREKVFKVVSRIPKGHILMFVDKPCLPVRCLKNTI